MSKTKDILLEPVASNNPICTADSGYLLGASCNYQHESRVRYVYRSNHCLCILQPICFIDPPSYSQQYSHYCSDDNYRLIGNYG